MIESRFIMFDIRELRLMFNDPMDFIIFYINLVLLKNKRIKIIFS